jgi:hypothetical protein
MRGTVADLGEYQSGVVSLGCLTLPSEFSFPSTAQHQTHRGQIIDLDLQHTNEAQQTASMFAQIKSVESSAMNNLQFKVTCDTSMTGVPFSLVQPFPSSMPIIIGFDGLEEGSESLDLRIYRTNELDLDNSSERTCFPLPPLARSPNLFLAFGQKTEEISRCRLTRLLF